MFYFPQWKQAGKEFNKRDACILFYRCGILLCLSEYRMLMAPLFACCSVFFSSGLQPVLCKFTLHINSRFSSHRLNELWHNTLEGVISVKNRWIMWFAAMQHTFTCTTDFTGYFYWFLLWFSLKHWFEIHYFIMLYTHVSVIWTINVFVLMNFIWCDFTKCDIVY